MPGLSGLGTKRLRRSLLGAWSRAAARDSVGPKDHPPEASLHLPAAEDWILPGNLAIKNVENVVTIDYYL